MHELQKISIQFAVSVLTVFAAWQAATAQTPGNVRHQSHIDVIRGLVTDAEDKTGLSNATVLLFHGTEKNHFKYSFSNEQGVFEFTQIPNEPFRVHISHVGYKDTIITLIPVGYTPVHLGIIQLSRLPAQLQTIELLVTKPLMEQDVDKLIYHVDADPESHTASAFDILRKVPMITTDEEDNLQLNGNGNYRILINGRPSSFFSTNKSDMLKHLSANGIKTLEVSTIPPSRYDAEGAGGIINITTNKKNIGGYTGGINLVSGSPRNSGTNGNLTAGRGKIAVSGNFSFNSRTNPPSHNSSLRINKTDQHTLAQVGKADAQYLTQSQGAALSYEINENNKINLSFGYKETEGTNRFGQQTTSFDYTGTASGSYENLGLSRTESRGTDIGFDYEHGFKKDKAQLLTLSYTLRNSTDHYNSNFTLWPGLINMPLERVTVNTDKTCEHKLQADYVQPIKTHTLEMGASAEFGPNSSGYFYRIKDSVTGAVITDPNQSNVFNYNEALYSAYTSFTLRNRKWNLKAGARLELVNLDASFVSSGTSARQEYLKLMPVFTLMRQFKTTRNIKFSYTWRMQRPGLYQLDPYTDFADPLNISYGNPNLKPGLLHLFNMSYSQTMKSIGIYANLVHQFTRNSIQQYTFLESDSIAITTYGNVGSNQSSSGSLALNRTFFKKLDLRVNLMGNYIQYSTLIKDLFYASDGFTYNAAVAATLHLGRWRAATNITYNSPNIFLQGRSAGYISNSLTIHKYFLKTKQASMALSVNSLFRENRNSTVELTDPAFYQLRKSSTRVRRFNISFNYRFAKL